MKIIDDESRIRRRALQVAVVLVERLGKEYTVLLPKAMLFLAELPEDPELEVPNS